MYRKQIYLDKEMDHSLKELSILKKTPLAAIVREAIREYLSQIKLERKQKKNPLYELVGLCEEGKTDASIKHDDYLYKEEE
ncbi:ribbon-helix-helix protein, CopG family [bacterium]|nr:ribbon-helix-helix protein, CopG family [bacterium]